jgi:uncharacterized protein (DUF2384 family)
VHLARRFARLRAVEERTAPALIEADAQDLGLAPLIEMARRVWREKASYWWTRPTAPLGGPSLRNVALQGAAGRAAVETLIGRIEHGIYG